MLINPRNLDYKSLLIPVCRNVIDISYRYKIGKQTTKKPLSVLVSTDDFRCLNKSLQVYPSIRHATSCAPLSSGKGMIDWIATMTGE